MTPAVLTRWSIAALLFQILNERHVAARLVVGKARADVVVPPLMSNLTIANVLFFRAWVQNDDTHLLLNLIENLAERSPWILLTPESCLECPFIGINQVAHFIAIAVTKQGKQELEYPHVGPG